MFKFITYNNQEVAISLLNQLLISNQQFNTKELLSQHLISNDLASTLANTFKQTSYVVTNNQLSKNRLINHGLKFAGISSPPKHSMISQINRFLIKDFFDDLKSGHLEVSEIAELEAKHLLLGLAKNAKFERIKPLQSQIAGLNKAEVNLLVKELFKNSSSQQKPWLNIDYEHAESYVWILAQLLQVLIATQANAYLKFLYQGKYDFDTDEIKQLKQHFIATKTAIECETSLETVLDFSEQGKLLRNPELGQKIATSMEAGLASLTAEPSDPASPADSKLPKFTLNKISYETYFQAVSLQADIRKYLVRHSDFVYELLNSDLDFAQGEANPEVKAFIAKFFVPELQDEYLAAKLDLIHKGLLLTTRYQIDKGLDFFTDNWQKLVEQIARVSYQNPNLAKHGNLSIYSDANSAHDPDSTPDSGSNHDLYAHGGATKLSDYHGSPSTDSAQGNDASTIRSDLSQLATELKEIKKSLSLNNFDAITFINSSKFVLGEKQVAENAKVISKDHRDLYLFNIRLYAPYQLNFYRKVVEVYDYNLYIFNQSPTYQFWGTSAKFPKLEQFYRKQQEYALRLNAEPSAEANFSSYSNKTANSQTNNNLLSSWGKLVQRSERIIEEIPVEKIFFYNYDLAEVQQHQAQNWQAYKQALEQALAKVAQKHQLPAGASENSAAVNLVALQQDLQQELQLALAPVKFKPLPNLLTQLKHHLLTYEHLDLQDKGFVLQQGDDSIRIHNAYSKRRELEYAYNYILQALTENPSLKLSDILILAPQISNYRSFIQQIFGQEKPLSSIAEAGFSAPKNKQGSKRYLPFQIFNEQPDDEVKSFIENIFNMDAHKFSLVDLQVFFNTPFAQEFYQLKSKELDLLTKLLDEHATSESFAFAEDGLSGDSVLVAHQLMSVGAGSQGLQLSNEEIKQLPLDFNSWQQVLFRAELDSVLEYEAEENFLAGVGLEAAREESASIAKLSLAINDLFALVQFKQQSHCLADWLEFFRKLILQFFPEQKDPEIYKHLMRVHASLKNNAYNSASLQLEINRQPFLNQILEVYKQKNRQLLNHNHLTFASVDDYQDQNYKVLIVLGMNAGEFPGSLSETELDLSPYFLVPTNIPSKQERYSNACLEFLLNTSEKVLFSYIGQSSDNKELKPAKILADLITFLDNHCGALEFSDKGIDAELEKQGEQSNNSELVITPVELATEVKEVYALLGFDKFTWQDLKASLVITDIPEQSKSDKFSEYQLIKGTAYSFSESNYKLELSPWQNSSLVQSFADKIEQETSLGLQPLVSSQESAKEEKKSGKADSPTSSQAVLAELASNLPLNKANFFSEWLEAKQSKELDLPFIETESLAKAYKELVDLLKSEVSKDKLTQLTAQEAVSGDNSTLTKVNFNYDLGRFCNDKDKTKAFLQKFALEEKRKYQTKEVLVGDAKKPNSSYQYQSAILSDHNSTEDFIRQNILIGKYSSEHYHRADFQDFLQQLDYIFSHKNEQDSIPLTSQDNLAEDILGNLDSLEFPQSYQLKNRKASLYFKLSAEFIASLRAKLADINSAYRELLQQRFPNLDREELHDLIPESSIAILPAEADNATEDGTETKEATTPETIIEIEAGFEEYYPQATADNPHSGHCFLLLKRLIPDDKVNITLTLHDVLTILLYAKVNGDELNDSGLPNLAFLTLKEGKKGKEGKKDGIKFYLKVLSYAEDYLCHIIDREHRNTMVEKAFLHYLIAKELLLNFDSEFTTEKDNNTLQLLSELKQSVDELFDYGLLSRKYLGNPPKSTKSTGSTKKKKS